MNTGRAVPRATLVALTFAALCAPHAAIAQRGFGCSYDSPFELSKTYWHNPLQHNVPYDGRLNIARIWYAGYYAFCSASAPYGDEVSAGWAHDFPHPEQNLALMITGLATIHAYMGGANIFTFDDPALRRFPIAYLTEPGGWVPNAKEAAAAHDYLTKGGFLIIDDWRGPYATDRTIAALRAIFPALKPIRVPDSHPIFNSFFQLKDPQSLLRNQNGFYGGRADYWGIFENNDVNRRMMVICDVNEDIKDYWVWSFTGRDAIDVSNQAYKLGINYLAYAMTR
jgi:hypothetical protein